MNMQEEQALRDAQDGDAVEVTDVHEAADFVAALKPVAKYRKKSVVVEALQLRWDTWNEMCDFADVGSVEEGKPHGQMGEGRSLQLIIPANEPMHNHDLLVDENDWIIKGVNGKFEYLKPDIFEATYEAVE